MVTELAGFDIPFNEIESTAMAHVAEAYDLRHRAAGDPQGPIVPVNPADGFTAVNEMLLRVRSRSDRMDELLARVTLMKGRARRAQEQAKFEAEQAFDEAMRLNQGRRREYESAAEKKAEASLESFEQRRMEHLAQRLTDITSDAYEVVNQMHWQLDAIRKDLRATLHSLQFESSLER